MEEESALQPYRVLDLTDDKGCLCGRILADLGADVLKIEKPGGDPVRNIGPFWHDKPDPEMSLYWFAYNMNKRGITLNIETIQGRDIFKKLVKTADLLIESFPIDYMHSLELNYDALSKLNRGLVFTSITPFGETGPYKDYKTCDLVALAMGGWMQLCGDADRPPTRVSFPQAYLNAGADAAVASLLALYHREVTGEGQHIDVSIRDSIIQLTANAIPWAWMRGVNLNRAGPNRIGLSAAGPYRQQWRCKDGHVTFAIYGGESGIISNKALVQWMDEEGMADEFLKGVDWDQFDMAKLTLEWQERSLKPIERFFRMHTKQELYSEAIKRRIMLYPVSTFSDLLESEQLRARNFWMEVDHEELDTKITYPWPFTRATETPLKFKRRAPLIGEHNEEIYGELGFSGKDLIILKEANVI